MVDQYLLLLVLFFLLFFCNEFASESGPQIRHCRSQRTWKRRRLSVEPAAAAGHPDLRVAAAAAGSSGRPATTAAAGRRNRTAASVSFFGCLVHSGTTHHTLSRVKTKARRATPQLLGALVHVAGDGWTAGAALRGGGGRGQSAASWLPSMLTS